MNSIRQEIQIGVNLSIKIKEVFFGDKVWSPKIAVQVGQKMREFRALMSLKGMNGDNFSAQDIVDAFEFYNDNTEVLCNIEHEKAIGDHLKRL